MANIVADSFKTQLLQGVHNFTNVTAVPTVVGAGTGVYTVTLTGGANNGLTGQRIVFTGFTTTANNGTYIITASSSTTVTTTNTASANSVAGSPVATIGDVFKLALYTSSASFTVGTTNYASTNEVSSSGYSAGGSALTSTTPTLSSDTAVCNFSTLTFTTVTLTARYALIYNSSQVLNAAGGAACVVLDFGTDQTATAGNFVITFPTADSTHAIIRLA